MNSEQADRNDRYLAAPDATRRVPRLAETEATVADQRGPGTKSHPAEERRNPPRASPPRRACRLTGDSRQHVPAREASARSKSAPFHAKQGCCFSSKALLPRPVGFEDYPFTSLIVLNLLFGDAPFGVFVILAFTVALPFLFSRFRTLPFGLIASSVLGGARTRDGHVVGLHLVRLRAELARTLGDLDGQRRGSRVLVLLHLAMWTRRAGEAERAARGAVRVRLGHDHHRSPRGGCCRSRGGHKPVGFLFHVDPADDPKVLD